MEKPTLRIARIKAGWSQVQLAKVCDVTQLTISNLETGKHSPRDLTRRQIEAICGPIDWAGTKTEAIIRNNGKHQSPAL